MTGVKTCPACRTGQLTVMRQRCRSAKCQQPGTHDRVIACRNCGLSLADPAGAGARAAARLLGLTVAGRVIVAVCSLLLGMLTGAIAVLAVIAVAQSAGATLALFVTVGGLAAGAMIIWIWRKGPSR